MHWHWTSRMEALKMKEKIFWIEQATQRPAQPSTIIITTYAVRLFHFLRLYLARNGHIVCSHTVRLVKSVVVIRFVKSVKMKSHTIHYGRLAGWLAG